jgi:predicted NUDIX family NTP pyrophosphohydrolase
MKQTAGTLLYRYTDHGLEVLLVHASGNYNKHASWSIPKGLPDPSEHFEQAARRETQEETGVIAGELTSLGYVDYTKTRKRIHCFAGLAPADAAPKVASWEVDKVEFVSIDKANEIIHPDQAPLLKRLREQLKSTQGR